MIIQQQSPILRGIQVKISFGKRNTYGFALVLAEEFSGTGIAFQAEQSGEEKGGEEGGDAGVGTIIGDDDGIGMQGILVEKLAEELGLNKGLIYEYKQEGFGLGGHCCTGTGYNGTPHPAGPIRIFDGLYG